MKWIKLFEDFKTNNEEGTLIGVDDIIECIKKGGSIFTTIIRNYPDNDPNVPIKPVDIDEDGLITVDIDGNQYVVELRNVQKIEM